MDNEWEYEVSYYEGQDSDGTYWSDWMPHTKEHALKIWQTNPLNTRIRSIYYGFKDE